MGLPGGPLRLGHGGEYGLRRSPENSYCGSVHTEPHLRRRGLCGSVRDKGDRTQPFPAGEASHPGVWVPQPHAEQQLLGDRVI